MKEREKITLLFIVFWIIFINFAHSKQRWLTQPGRVSGTACVTYLINKENKDNLNYILSKRSDYEQ